MKVSTTKFTVITVNYNSEKYLFKLIRSLSYIKNLIDCIIVVDNNSMLQRNLNRLKNHSNLKLILNNKNLGFSKAVNQAIHVAKSEYILLLNPDCFLTDNSIVNIFNRIKQRNNIGAIGGKIIDPNTNLRSYTANSKPSFLTGIFEFTNLKKVFPKNIFSKNFWIENSHISQSPIAVNSICGAFMLFRRKINNKLNLFDEDYFLYLEDIQFGQNINNAGKLVMFDPSSKISHYGGKSNDSKYGTVLKHWYKSRKIFFSKNLKRPYSDLLYIIFSIEEILLKIYHKATSTPNE
ncbi:MAG: glycosyltransferase family 2 protein [Microgenomates group bacterium]